MNSEEIIKLHIGIDDTDSADGMCTTYLTYLIIEDMHTKQRLILKSPPPFTNR